MIYYYLIYRPGKPLPSDDKIVQFLTNSKKGVVYMSFGTVIKSSLMSDQTKEIFRKMFLKFSEYPDLFNFIMYFVIFSFFSFISTSG